MEAGKPNTFLLGAGIFILLLAALVTGLAVWGGNQPVKMLPETSPEGTVQRFLMAIQDREYVKAYGYLSRQSEKTKIAPYDNWVQSMQSRPDSAAWKAAIVKSTVRENDATVEVAVDKFRPEGPLANPVSSTRIIFLLQKEDGRWTINAPVDLFWLYY